MIAFAVSGVALCLFAAVLHFAMLFGFWGLVVVFAFPGAIVWLALCFFAGRKVIERLM